MTKANYLTSKEVADLFGVSRATVTRWAREGRLVSLVTLGRQRRYPRVEVERLLESLSSTKKISSLT